MMELEVFRSKDGAGSISVEGPNAPGLRERQKVARRARIQEQASILFETQGFEKTTMAAIAKSADVSTPTVFNYFPSKDELLLSLIQDLHHEIQRAMRSFEIDVNASIACTVSDFLALYTQVCLDFVNRDTWRHVESVRIRRPETRFAKTCQKLSDEMHEGFAIFLSRLHDALRPDKNLDLQPVATILFGYWGMRFIEFVRNEQISTEDHAEQLRSDISALISMRVDVH